MNEAFAMSVAPSERWKTATSHAKARPPSAINTLNQAGKGGRAIPASRRLARYRVQTHNAGSAKIIRHAALDNGPTSAKRTTIALHEMIAVPPSRARKPARSGRRLRTSKGSETVVTGEVVLSEAAATARPP